MLRIALGYGERGGQAQFASFLNLSPSQLNNYERGLKRPDIGVAINICTRTGATLDWIYRGERAGMPFDLISRLPDPEGHRSSGKAG